MSNRPKNFRRRANEDEDDKDETFNNSTGSNHKPSSKPPITKSTELKPKKPHQHASKLLSFADDEETQASSLTSSRHSSRISKPPFTSLHKITSAKDRLPLSSSSLPSNIQPQAGVYTKEVLRELQKNTKTLATSRSTSSNGKPSSSEPVIVLKGSVKPLDSISETLKQVDELDDANEEKEQKASSGKDSDDTENRLRSMGIGKGKDSSGSVIPDQATINAIRAKRERMRQSRAAAPDFISLDSGSNHGAAEGLSDEEPEFRGRIAMFGEKLDAVKKGVFEDVDDRLDHTGLLKREIDDDGGDDEEEKIWEEEQFRKGLGKRRDDGSTIVTSSIPAAQEVHQQYTYPAAASVYSPVPSVPPPPPLSIGGSSGMLHGLDMMPISQQASIARKALEENIMRLKESHGRTTLSLNRTDENLSASLSTIIALEGSLSAAGEKFIFMQKLREFVSVICDFLQHKAPLIEELEAQMQRFHEKRASAILERRAADNEDELKEVEAAVNAATSVFVKGGSSAAMIATASAAAQAAFGAVREETNLPVELDEFGRDINLKKRMDKTRRAEARQQRRARSDSRVMSAMEADASYQRIEGESSTDESDSESNTFKSSIIQTANEVFSDASEVYSQLSLVKERFEKWKKDYLSSYRDAYMPLSAPAIFSPYVRLELLKWDPLHEIVDFHSMRWHSLLFDYGLTENEFSPDDTDANLVPALVEKIALPILHHEIVYCWDILSTTQTKNAAFATKLIHAYFTESSEAFQELIIAVHTRLADAVANLMVPTWNPLVMRAVPNAARVAAYRFGVSVRLMRNICLWNEVLPKPALEKLALDELLSGKILPHVRSIASSVHDAITRTERVVASLSGVWAGSSVVKKQSHKLKPLVDYVLILRRNLEKKHSSGVAANETGGLARRLKKILIELDEYDEARAVSRTFNIKEAL